MPSDASSSPLSRSGKWSLDLPHLLRGGEGDVVTVAAPQEGIGELALGVRGDEDERPLARLDGLADLADRELAVLQHVEEVVLHVRLGLVDLVEEEHDALVAAEGAADGTPDHVVEEVVDV